MNIIIFVLSVFQSVMLILITITEMCYFEEVRSFFQTGMPNPSVCGPLFAIWVIVCALYWTKIVKSPKLSTIVAAVFVYFGTATLVGYPDFGLNWPTSVHIMEAYIGYGYFIESLVSKYKLW